jgi:hypothetical protein
MTAETWAHVGLRFGQGLVAVLATTVAWHLFGFAFWRLFTDTLAKRWKKYDIMKVIDGGAPQLYLRRYFIWRSRWFNIYLHHIVLPDLDADPHDHPWSFVSLLLSGGYVEQRWVWRQGEPFNNLTRARWWWDFRLKVGSLGYRPGSAVHQIARVLPNTWTLVFTGPRNRSWGFLTESGWVHWRKYLNMPDKVHATDPEID